MLLGEVGGPALADRYAGAKKAEISRSCHALFAGEAIVEAEVKEKALAWVPDAMRFLDSAEGSLEEPGSEDVLDAANDPQGGDEGVAETAASAADGFEVPDEEAVPVAA